jgi:hydroxymethylpyrimidine/phosphomethylpyrimidine kinase
LITVLKYSIGPVTADEKYRFVVIFNQYVARGARRAESVTLIGHQPSEPDPGHSGEGTATTRFDGSTTRRRHLPPAFFMSLQDACMVEPNIPLIGSVPKAMTVAGSDSGAGAGIQADLKTFAALGVYGTSALTAVTAQNTVEVLAIAEVPEEVVAAQIDGVLEDIGADAVKTGMLSCASIIATVADRLEAWGVTKLVVDPVMVAKSGDRLLQTDAIDTLKSTLLPLAMVVTPNLPEAEVLSGITIQTEADAHRAAEAIFALGPRFVVIKGGHRFDAPIDVVYDGQRFLELAADRIDTPNTHGTGCTFSAAIAAYLARGAEPVEAISAAKTFVTDALRASYRIGNGHSPVNHFHSIHHREPAIIGAKER